MIAYCRNSPVFRIDISGTYDLECNNTNPVDDELVHEEGGLSGSNGSTDPGTGSNTIPQYVHDVWKYIKTHNGSPPPGYKGGRPFANDGRANSEMLPDSGGPYREYDVHPNQPGVNRGSERLVIGIHDTAWYTSDHYKSFTRLE